MMEMIDEFLTTASVKGFRTLLMAMKVLEKRDVDEFIAKCAKAELNIATREKELAKIFNEFEKDLVLIGATCVEDRL
jgi:magnesium-transporting ATPase (P-type)